MEGVGADENYVQVVKNDGESQLLINRAVEADVTVEAYTPSGICLGTVFDGTASAGCTIIPVSHLGKGVLIFIVSHPEGREAVKATL